MSLPKYLRTTTQSSEIPEIVRLWALRILVPLKAQQNFIGKYSYTDDVLAIKLGLTQIDCPESFDEKTARSELLKIYKKYEHTKLIDKPANVLTRNINKLATIVGFSEVDCQILAFASWVHNESELKEYCDLLGDLNMVKSIHVLSILLEIPEHDIRFSLSTQGLLFKTGLLRFNRSNEGNLGYKLNLISPNFASDLFLEDTDPIHLIKDLVTEAKNPTLTISDFDHINAILKLLRHYLKNAVINTRIGVNVLIYGAPGTGKSQLALVLAKELNCDLYEISSKNEEGRPLGGERRLQAYRAAQSIFSKNNTMILFDEVEDVFTDSQDHDSYAHRPSYSTGKALMNNMLEENTIPTIWITNCVDSIDPAYIRRFDITFELPIPPRKQRERIIKNVCGDLINVGSLRLISQSESLTPAVVSRVASVVGSIQDDLKPEEHSNAVELLINHTLIAQGHEPIGKNSSNRLPEVYDPSFINADANLAQIAKGLMQSQSGRLCLYGPPGTGKTAYGRWLSEQLGKPLVVKRASDLMSMWVGGNEKNIANAFKQAEEANAILLIDEVDSFLQDRRGAQRGWEASLVNEMLTQMESFSGIFVASTNLMNGLDQAALRRFDLKVKFDYLKPVQAWMLLIRYCKTLEIQIPQKVDRVRLNQLQNLTPGDFAVVARQHKFRSIESKGELIDALANESQLKEDKSTNIGFLS